MTDPAHRQAGHPVRLEWGPTGAAAIVEGTAYAVVVDVLSFTTTLSVAVERGMTVYPYRWKDERATAYAAERDAVLAVGRLEARQAGGGVSLSPADLAVVEGVERIVLPSPNGSSISYALADSGASVVGGCLRNAGAVARWLAPRLAEGVGLAVVAAGERWPDDSLRPAVEDLWGAGAVLAALADLGVGGFSPEAAASAAAFVAVRERLAEALLGCASGQELLARGFAADVEIAAGLDASLVVPLLDGESFSAAPPG